jgi:hypothetical protein
MYTGPPSPKVVDSARRPFTVEEDVRLLEIMGRTPVVNWEAIAQQVGGRSARQCRERWVNYLNPKIRNEPWTEEEDRLLVEKINELGHCWASIGHHFNGRSESDVKNRWYSHLRCRSVSDPDSGCLSLVTGQRVGPATPERKKRPRSKASPQESALRLLKRRRAPPMRVPLVEPILPTLAKPQKNDTEILDLWDQTLFDTTNEDRFDVFKPEGQSGNGL